MKHDGGEKEKELGPGGYNYMPSKMVHEAWVGPDGNLLFITVDGPWARTLKCRQSTRILLAYRISELSQFLEVAKKWRHMAAYEEKHSR